MTAFIDANRDDVVEGRRLGVEPICEVLQVAPSTDYAARDRPPSPRAQRDAQLTPRLTEIWQDNYQVYGSRKLWKTARRGGIDIGRDQTARLMRQAGIQGVLQVGTNVESVTHNSLGSEAVNCRPTRSGCRPALASRRVVRTPGPAWPTCVSSSTRSPG